MRDQYFGEQSNPVAWCEQKGFSLEPVAKEALSVVASEGNRTDTFGAYLLGYAGMDVILRHPNESQGLSLAYRFVEYLDDHGAAYAGADDRLSKEDFVSNQAAIEEVSRYISGLAADPLRHARTYERQWLAQAQQSWEVAGSVEQAFSFLHENVVLDLPVAHVLDAFLESHVQRVSAWLDDLRYPAFVATTVRMLRSLDVGKTVELLKYLEPIFDEQGKWTGACAARMLMDRFENYCLDSIGQNRRGAIDCIAPEEAPENKRIQEEIGAIVPALSSRSDGKRLLTEWLAHLLDEINRREASQTEISIKAGYAETVRHFAANVFQQVELKNSATLAEIYSLFVGETIAKIESIKPPSWINSLGHRDVFIPLAVAATLHGDKDDREEAYSCLPWFIDVFQYLSANPELMESTIRPGPTLLSVLACPIGYSLDPAKQMEVIWKNASDARLKARFHRSGHPNHVRDLLQVILEIGLTTFRLLVTIPNGTESARKLATVLKTILDEIRYAIPLVFEDFVISCVSDLTMSMSKHGFLNSVSDCAAHFRLYKGDDDVLVGAVVSAVKGGVDTKTVSQAIVDIGINPKQLMEAYRSWHSNKKDDVARQDYLESLALIADFSNAAAS